MNLRKFFTAAFATLMVGTAAQARSLKDVDIIFVRGYTSEVVWDDKMPKYGQSTFDSYWKPLDDAYWNYYKNTLLGGSRMRMIGFYWSSKDRLQQGVVRSVADRVKAAVQDGNFCKNGCVMITHSTGGLVGDYLLSSALDSEGTSYDYKVVHDKVNLVIHLASAAGGSELASVVRDLSFGVGCTNSVTQTIAEWMFKGVKCGGGEDTIGVTNDLVPSRARSVNGSSETFTPTLMLAGEGTAGFQGAFGNMLLPGNDDSVVAMHSTCGANTANGIDSCVNYRKPSGEVASVTGPSGYYRAHYPWIMTQEDHGEMIEVQRALDADDQETLVTKGYGSFTEVTSSSGWWYWATEYKRLKDDAIKTSGKLIVDHFNF